jgi:hypothetical protein
MSGDGSKVTWFSAKLAGSPDVPATMIRTGNTDGSAVVMVAGSENASGPLSLAADGAKVAFVKDTNITDGKGIYGLFVGNADGTGIPTLIDIGNPVGDDSTGILAVPVVMALHCQAMSTLVFATQNSTQ